MIKHFFKNTALTLTALTLVANSVAAVTFIGNDPNSTPPEVVLPSNPPAQQQVELRIVDHDVDNGIFDPWDEQEAEISFTLNKEASITLEIRDEGSHEVDTLVDDRNYAAGEYRVKWDGEDLFGDLVDDGDYSYRITARSGLEVDRVSARIVVKRGYDQENVETVDPRIKRVYLTKEKFDPGIKEKNYIVFSLTAKADVRGFIDDNNGDQIYKFIDRDNLEAGTYAIKIDADELSNYGGILKYRLTADNARGNDLVTGEFRVEAENDRADHKPNIYNDYSNGTPYSPATGHMSINFKTDRSSSVTVEIRDEDFLLRTVTDELDLPQGSHTVYWDGRDNDGDLLSDGVYNYKIIAENDRGRDAEYGNFSVEESFDAISDEIGGTRCAGFTDVLSSNEYCEAIEWAKNRNVIQGFADNTLKPNQPVTRAQAVKMILEALNVNLLSANGENLGFSDIYRYDWYMDYLKTAFSLGVVKGYEDGTFRPNQYVLRAEGVIMLTNAAQAKDGIIVPSRFYGQPYLDVPNTGDTRWYISEAWFAQDNDLTNDEHYFYPLDYMTRAEVVDMLYRYKRAGL